MRTLAFFKKTFLENLRDWKILILALVFAPFFVYLMYGYFGAVAPAYKLQVANRDGAASAPLVAAWREAKHPDGNPVFRVTEVTDLDEARTRVETRDADLLIQIPEGFSRSLTDFRQRKTQTPAVLVSHVDEANMRSSMAMAFSDYVSFTYAFVVTGVTLPVTIDLERLGKAQKLSEFDLYVPALLVLALIMIMFTAAATLIKEVDKGTMSRLMLSKLTTSELMTAISATQVMIGVLALALAYLAALSVGYRGEGSMLALLVVGGVSTLGVVAMSILVAAWLKTIFELLTVGCFPFFIVMFFSEAMFPLPKVTLFHLIGNPFYLNDILPTSITVRAFNRILNYGAGLSDIVYELCAIVVTSTAYYALGVWWFRKRHMRV